MTLRTGEIKAEVEAILTKLDLMEKLCGSLVVDTPLTGEEIARVGVDGQDTLATRVDKASLAQRKWRASDMETRGAFLAFLADEITKDGDGLAKLVHYDSAKSVKESAIEVGSVVALIKNTLKAASYDALPSGASRVKEFSPLGVILVISPFNFPLAIGMWTGIPALLAGNAVINKPSEHATLAPLAYEGIFKAASKRFNAERGTDLVPDNIFQVAPGGPEVGKVLAADKRIAKVVFTGSIAGCEKIKQADRETDRRAIALTEGGAANFAVISDKHAPLARGDYIRFVVGAIMKSFLPYAGQKCVNTRQLFVHETILDETVEEFKNQLGAFRSGWEIRKAFSNENPFEYTPLINRGAGERFQWALRQAVEQGGELIGGEQFGRDTHPGAQFFMPAIAVFRQRVPLMDEEIFGPFLMVMPCSGDIHRALELARKPNANLVNAFYGSDQVEIGVFKENNTAGFTLINPPLGTGLLPLYGLGFGGNGLSGQGESLAREPLLPFVDVNGPIRRNVTFALPIPQEG